MPYDSPDSRHASEYDEFVKDLLARSKPISGLLREEWRLRFEDFIRDRFPDHEMRFTKPGVPQRLCFAEVALPDQDLDLLMDMAAVLDDTWKELAKPFISTGASVLYPDRRDAIYDFALEVIEGGFFTAGVKLRSFPFERYDPRRERNVRHEREGRAEFDARARPPGRPKR